MRKDPKAYERRSWFTPSLPRFIERLPLRLIIYSPLFGALLVVALGASLRTRVAAFQDLPRFYDLVGAVAFIVASLSGLLQIHFQEVPGRLGSLTGRGAVILGIIWTVGFVVLAGFMLWDYLLGLPSTGG